MTDEKKVESPVSKPKRVVSTTKRIRNMGKNKIELVIDGKVIPLLPRQTCEVPEEYDVPKGVNLLVLI
jgi:hypothetical protein|uniref:Uncharacterized protein n=1 Tax=Myoviridae sp. ctByu2 TaxID=2827668 RepID=A0A8S5S9F1_9CAUD|nr:MAG TPA: hypothetical protein [Myoviridae sp. ctByu2]